MLSQETLLMHADALLVDPNGEGDDVPVQFLSHKK